MQLTRSDRFRMKSRLIEHLRQDTATWGFEQQNLLLAEFDCQTMDDSYNGPGFGELISTLSDANLTEMYKLVTGESSEQLEGQIDSAPSGNWSPGHIRLFLSHSATQKKLAGDVARELAVTGIQGFVAHDAMEYTKPWQTQIEQALSSMQLFVALVHPAFTESSWCQQEVGWALGRSVPRFAVRFGADPVGFLGSDQWPSGQSFNARQIAALISAWVATLPEIGDALVQALFRALASARNYIDAGASASKIAALSELTDEQWQTLGQIYSGNDQVYNGGLAIKALRPFFQEHGRTWPPSAAGR